MAWKVCVSVKRDLIQSQKETYYSVKRDLLQCQTRPNTKPKSEPYYHCFTFSKVSALVYFLYQGTV